MNPDFALLESTIQSGKTVELPADLKSWLGKTRRLFIDGTWRDGEGGKTFDTLHPGDGRTLAKVSLAGKQDVYSAVDAAQASFRRGDWSQVGIEERADLLRRIAQLILEHRAPLAILESLDTGKPLRESFEGDIPRAAHNFNFFADFVQANERMTFENPNETHVAFREPLGAVALVTPWNLPLYLETWKLAPALLMGNSCILKPSELTPLTASYLAELIEQVGLPRGVFQLVQGFGENSTGEHLVSHPGVAAISFTGETATGRAIMKAASVGPTRVSFEMGGKGACVVFADASIEKAVDECVRGAFRNQGEICLATPRIFVEKSAFDEFLARFVSKVKDLRVGDPLSYHTSMGALVSQEHLNKVTGYLKGLPPKTRIVCGGNRPPGTKGFFLEPTVVVGADPEDKISQEEVFGPVACIYPFSTEEEVLKAVNGTAYGLSASVWTEDLEKAQRISQKIRTGLVWINCWFVRDLRVPFGGQKRSGVGREGGRFSLDFFSEWKSVCIRHSKV